MIAIKNHQIPKHHNLFMQMQIALCNVIKSSQGHCQHNEIAANVSKI